MKSTNPLAALFGRSPFKPMQEHMGLVATAAAQVLPLVEALISGEHAALTQARARIDDAGRSADALRREIRSNLPRGLFMPVDRRDLLELLDLQDTIADTAQAVAGLLEARLLPVPAGMQADLRALVDHSAQSCALAADIINELDELVETGFQGTEAARVKQMIAALGQREDTTAALTLALTQSLFRHEDEQGAVAVLLWYRLIGWLRDLAAQAGRVGERVLLLIAR